MLTVFSKSPAVSSSLTAGLLLASLPLLACLDLPRPTATAVILATGSSRSRAYEVKAAVESAVAGLVHLRVVRRHPLSCRNQTLRPRSLARFCAT